MGPGTSMHKSIKTALTLLLLLMAAISVPAQIQSPKDPLVIAISPDFQPFTFINAEGEPAGMFVDIWQLWAKKTGRKIDFISSDWNTSLENLKNERADIHSGLFFTPDRAAWLSSSPPIYEVGVTLFYPVKNGTVSSLSELSGQVVAVIKGTLQERYLQKNYPDIEVLSCNSREELVSQTHSGKAKGFMISFPAGKSLIDRKGLSGEFDSLAKVLYREKFQPGILRKNVELTALVAKGFNLLSAQELAAIEARWLPNPAQQHFNSLQKIKLSSEEEVWLTNHKTIRIGMTPLFPPLKFSEQGVIKGIEPDYLDLLAEYTGIRFEYVIAAFSELDAKVKTGEIDMFISFNIPERLAYMSFTQPFLEFKEVIVTRSDTPFISGVSSLQGMKVATVKGVRIFDKFLSRYPDIKRVQVDTMEQMFKAVAESRADALLSKTVFTGYMLQNFPNLKIAGIVDLPSEPFLYAVRKDYPELVSILNKAITAIPKERQDAVVQKWFNIKVEYQPNWHEIKEWSAVTVGAIALILGLTAIWTRRLTKEIDVRKQIEENLRKSDERHRTILQTATSGILSADLQGRLLEVNKAFCHMTGYSEAELRTMHIADLEVSESAEEIATRIGEIRELGEAQFESRHRRKDGTVIDVEVSVQFQPDDGGQLIVFVKDITERTIAMGSLIKSEEKFRLLFQNMPAGFALHEIIVDANGEPCDYRFLEINPAFELLTGLKAANLVGRTQLEILPHLETSWLEKYEQVALTGKPINFENYSNELGKHYQVSAYSPEAGKFATIFLDISERIKAENSLVKAQQLHAETERIGKVGGWQVDLGTMEQTWTEEVYRIHEVDTSFKPTVENGISFYAPDSRPIINQAVQRASEQGEPFDVELEIITAKDNVKAVKIIGWADLEHGRIFGFFQDITERKRAEEEKARLEGQLLQAQKIESVGRLAGGVAHDFNNMLSVILGHTELALMHIDQHHPISTSLQEISKAANHSAELTRQLLTFARKQTVIPRVLDLNESVSGMLSMLRHLIGENIRLNWQPEADLWPIMMDSSQIDQIMANLCVNARDAISDVGEITITTADCSVDENYCKTHPYASPGDYVKIVVSDNGKGMDKETLEHIFEPFFTTKEVGKGTGLGLATVYGIVRQNNGFITVFSETGTGTAFTIYLPRHGDQAEQSAKEVVSKPTHQGSETILLVEDEPAILQMITMTLSQMEYSVLQASTPAEAIHLAREHSGGIDILITDVIMPEMNGRELARNIQIFHPHIKQLFMSGYTADIIANHGVLDDGINFIQKPFQMHALFAKLRDVLNG